MLFISYYWSSRWYTVDTFYWNYQFRDINLYCSVHNMSSETIHFTTVAATTRNDEKINDLQRIFIVVEAIIPYILKTSRYNNTMYNLGPSFRILLFRNSFTYIQIYGSCPIIQFVVWVLIVITFLFFQNMFIFDVFVQFFFSCTNYDSTSLIFLIFSFLSHFKFLK